MDIDLQATQLDAERADVLRQLRALQQDDREPSPAKPPSEVAPAQPPSALPVAPPTPASATAAQPPVPPRTTRASVAAATPGASPALSQRYATTPALPPTTPLLGAAAEANPQITLNQLLLACENEVRECKGFVVDEGPPIKVARCRLGEIPPHDATYLSRPEGTGVDFTVPVDIAGYKDVIKKPITLNMIRERCRVGRYARYEEYLEDMRLLARNTRKFNTEAPVQWIVQHAELLLETAEESVQNRKLALVDAEEKIAKKNSQARTSTRGALAVSKRKREEENTRMQLGMLIECFYDKDKKWYPCRVTQEDTQEGKMGIQYIKDGFFEWVTPDEVKWRPTVKTLVTLEDVENLRGEVLGRIDELKVALAAEMRFCVERLEQSYGAKSTMGAVHNSMQRAATMLQDTIAEQAIEMQALREKLWEELGAQRQSKRPRPAENGLPESNEPVKQDAGDSERVDAGNGNVEQKPLEVEVNAHPSNGRNEGVGVPPSSQAGENETPRMPLDTQASGNVDTAPQEEAVPAPE